MSQPSAWGPRHAGAGERSDVFSQGTGGARRRLLRRAAPRPAPPGHPAADVPGDGPRLPERLRQPRAAPGPGGGGRLRPADPGARPDPEGRGRGGPGRPHRRRPRRGPGTAARPGAVRRLRPRRRPARAADRLGRLGHERPRGPEGLHPARRRTGRAAHRHRRGHPGRGRPHRPGTLLPPGRRQHRRLRLGRGGRWRGRRPADAAAGAAGRRRLPGRQPHRHRPRQAPSSTWPTTASGRSGA